MTKTYSTIDHQHIISLGKLKVLLAEDNEVNQLLAKGILRYWGMETKVASTGNEVIEFLTDEDFDLVLMDIQMPEKSGIEAATEIRNLVDYKKKNIPIIALTANALKGEEKKYVAAGMDDFLTKPFKEGDLYEVIERVLRKEGAFGRKMSYQKVEIKAETKKADEENLYDLKQLEEIAGGNTDFLTALAKIYLDTIPSTSTEMVEATKAGEWDKTSKLAHKLKSTIDSLNMHAIIKDIRAIEVDAKNRVNTEIIKKLALHVDTVIKKVAVQLKADFSL
ncbi:response regulator [Segetibacter sp.]|jgi:CheY-like chemotaxis protein/HPt (histidine-containing phosphotransfer) domain-containing protein|uniref:response regulator n=1 Tax=Segetibacter sp. TaxID=2231182 RepID=UPI00260E26A3|nr:response regulator [Segetibacter sp.]MCW3078919.1 Hpt sensor hybrid histidine kinase [Segetibacter sp.]